MPVTATVVPSSIEPTKYQLVERVLYESYELSVRVRAHPENVAWEIQFDGVVGYRVLDERDLLQFWPTCRGWTLFEIHEGGWMPEATMTADHLKFGFYGKVREYFVAGEDICVNVLATSPPIVAQCD